MKWTDGNNYPDADGDFSNAPIFNFNDGKVKFNTNWTNNANENYGSASGFGSKSLPAKARGVERRLFAYRASRERIHPPSILPISSIIS